MAIPTKNLKSFPLDIDNRKDPREQGSSEIADFDKKEIEWDKPRVPAISHDILYIPGDFVEIDFSKDSPASHKNVIRGKIIEMYSNQAIPDIDAEIMGTAQDPALKIQLYEIINGKWKSLNKFIGLKMSILIRTAEKINNEHPNK